MAAFNFPVNATALEPLLHPSTTLDLDENGVAWVSILSSQLAKTSLDGVPVPFIKPLEVQIRTYVTGPDPHSKQQLKGVWLFDLFIDDPPSVLGARVLFGNTIRVLNGDINIDTSPHSAAYSLKAPKLQVADHATAAVTATSTILDTTVSFNPSFFLDRTAWFGRTRQGKLSVSVLRNISYMSAARQMRVSKFASSALSALSLGGDVGEEICEQHPEGCFFVGESDTTFESSVTVAGATPETSFV